MDSKSFLYPFSERRKEDIDEYIERIESRERFLYAFVDRLEQLDERHKAGLPEMRFHEAISVERKKKPVELSKAAKVCYKSETDKLGNRTYSFLET